MPYEILPHTADVGVAASAASLPELFSEAVRGLAAIMLDDEPPGSSDEATVRVEADDLALLLAGVLEEALYKWESRGTLAVGARLSVESGVAHGTFLLAHGLEARGPTIKAVTYHQLSVEQSGGEWRATVFFDV